MVLKDTLVGLIGPVSLVCLVCFSGFGGSTGSLDKSARLGVGGSGWCGVPSGLI